MGVLQDNSDYAAWRARLADANDPAFWPIEEIDRLLVDGLAQFWCDGDSALVTRVVDYPGGARALEAVAAAGKMDTLCDDIAPQVENWARSHGFTHLLIAGRPGWARVHSNWRHHQSVLLKELADG